MPMMSRARYANEIQREGWKQWGGMALRMVLMSGYSVGPDFCFWREC